MSCSKCNGSLDEKFHTCWRGEYQRFPFKFIGKQFIYKYKSISKISGRDKIVIYSGTITDFTGFRESPKFYFRYKPNKFDNSPSERYSFSMYSNIFNHLELLNDK